MIRPFTVISFLTALGSGLYVYQSKHEVQVLDRTIEKTVHETGALREQSRLLAAEWTMLNDPERLRQFSDTYLSLRTITPSQFTSLTDLDAKLPQPRIEVPKHDPDEATSLAPEPIGAPATTAVPDPAPALVANEVLPVPPIPVAPPQMALASISRPIEQKSAEQKSPDRPAVNRPAPVEARAVDLRPSEQHVAPRLAEARPPAPPAVAPAPAPPRAVTVAMAIPRPLPVNTPQPPSQQAPTLPPTRQAMATTQTPYGGSLLGMARGSSPSPTPRPMPVNATQWYNAN